MEGAGVFSDIDVPRIDAFSADGGELWMSMAGDARIFRSSGLTLRAWFNWVAVFNAVDFFSGLQSRWMAERAKASSPANATTSNERANPKNPAIIQVGIYEAKFFAALFSGVSPSVIFDFPMLMKHQAPGSKALSGAIFESPLEERGTGGVNPFSKARLMDRTFEMSDGPCVLSVSAM